MFLFYFSRLRIIIIPKPINNCVKNSEDCLTILTLAKHGDRKIFTHCDVCKVFMKGGRIPPLILSGSDQLLALDSIVHEATNRLLLGNYGAQLRHELLNILHVVVVLTTTSEGDANLAIIHIGDVLNGGRGEVKHNEKKGSVLSEVF